jgi:anti-sigma factor RsiW
MITCREAAQWVSAYADRELDAVSSLQMESHLAECPRCRAALERVDAVRTAVGAAGLTYAPPAELASRVRAAVGREAAPTRRRWRSAAVAGTAIAAALAWLVVGNVIGRGAERRLGDELVAGHVRSLMVDHLVDVASTDQHTVRPWFNGKIDFAPPVADFAASGFALVGGRMDYLAGRPVAALVYRHQAHLVNLFIWPDRAGASGTKTSTADGYSLVHWNDTDLAYWAVSDLNLHDLARFADLVRESRPRAPLAGE